MEKKDFSPDNIDRYLTGQMDQKELLEFEEQLSTDADLQKEVALRQQFIHIAKSSARAKIKEDLKPVQDEYLKNRALKKNMIKALRPILVIGGFLLFLTGLVIGDLLNPIFTTSPDMEKNKIRKDPDIPFAEPNIKYLRKEEVSIQPLETSDDQSTEITFGETVSLEIIEEPEASAPFYVFDSKKLKIFTSGKDLSFIDTIEVLVLFTENQEKEYILKTGDLVYPLLRDGQRHTLKADPFFQKNQ